MTGAILMPDAIGKVQRLSRVDDLTVVVKSFRRPYLLGLCLESLARFWPRDHARYFIVIADDGSDAATIDAIEAEFYSRGLYDYFVGNPRGTGKWALAREGRFSEVAHTCGETWNAAMSIVGTEYVFVIEDDCRLLTPSDPRWNIDLLRRRPDVLCAIGLRQRVELEARGFGTPAGEEPGHRLYTHASWPWSFDSIFFRRSDWARLGPWPTGISTGAMEDWLTGRLRATGLIDRPYAVTTEPMSAIDEQTRVRVDRPDLGAGAPPWRVYRQADACLRAWMEGRWRPTLDDAIEMGRVVYPEGLRPEDWQAGRAEA